MVEVRSADGKLLCRVTADFRRLEIVKRGVRYEVALPSMATGGVIFVSEIVEEIDETKRGT